MEWRLRWQKPSEISKFFNRKCFFFFFKKNKFLKNLQIYWPTCATTIIHHVYSEHHNTQHSKKNSELSVFMLSVICWVACFYCYAEWCAFVLSCWVMCFCIVMLSDVLLYCHAECHAFSNVMLALNWLSFCCCHNTMFFYCYAGCHVFIVILGDVFFYCFAVIMLRAVTPYTGMK
jgi:hypothetical protein